MLWNTPSTLLVVVAVTTLLSTSTACSDHDCTITLTCAPGGADGQGGSPTSSNPATGSAGGGGSSSSLTPRVLSIIPAFGSSGVRTDTPIVVTFSEPMDQPATNLAYEPSLAPSEQPAMSWNAEGTVLTIDPKLEYPTGPTPGETPSRTHTFAISTEARDLDGLPLESDVTHEFALARRVVQRLELLEPLESWRGNVSVGGGTGTFSFLGAGEASNQVNARLGFMTFDISPLPEISSALDIETITVEAAIRGISGDPFGKFGDMTFDSIVFANKNEVENAPALHQLGVFISASADLQVDDPISRDVTEAVVDDWQLRVTRNQRSQFRLFITTAVNGDGIHDFAHVYNTTGSTHLLATYLLP